MKPEIENLKAWMSGKSTTGYQRALAMREFEQLLTYVAELEQLLQTRVSGRSEQFVCGANRVMGEKRCEKQCGQCEELYPQTNCH